MKNDWIELFEASASAENALAGHSAERAVASMEPGGCLVIGYGTGVVGVRRAIRTRLYAAPTR
jgi:hypothetical protein